MLLKPIFVCLNHFVVLVCLLFAENLNLRNAEVTKISVLWLLNNGKVQCLLALFGWVLWLWLRLALPDLVHYLLHEEVRLFLGVESKVSLVFWSVIVDVFGFDASTKLFNKLLDLFARVYLSLACLKNHQDNIKTWFFHLSVLIHCFGGLLQLFKSQFLFKLLATIEKTQPFLMCYEIKPLGSLWKLLFGLKHDLRVFRLSFALNPHF